MTENILKELNSFFNSLMEKGISALKKQGITQTNKLIVSKKLDLRFKNTHTSLTIVEPEKNSLTLAEDYKKKFLKEYQQLFGYIHQNMSIEVVQCRLEINAPSFTPDTSTIIKQSHNKKNSFTSSEIIFKGKKQLTPIYQSMGLMSERLLKGLLLL